jgi:hypothetical protein
MGYLKDQYNMKMIGQVPEGTCPMCATKHKPEMPHNQQSLAYQYKFYDENGRWPTWEDAMAHCTDEMKGFWRKELEAKRIKLG